MLGEHLCSIYERSYGVPIVALRYFSVYGPRQRPDMAFWRLIDSALNATEMTIFGDGKQTRDFTYVADVVSATIAAAELAAAGAVYNIGGGSRIAITEAIELVSAEVGAPRPPGSCPSVALGIGSVDQKANTIRQRRGSDRHSCTCSLDECGGFPRCVR